MKPFYSLFAAAMILATAESAFADRDALKRAEELLLAVEYEDADALLQKLLADGTFTEPGDLAHAHALAGRVAASIGKEEKAVEHFRVWLSIDPQAALSSDTSPRILSLFDRAKQTAGSFQWTVEASPAAVEIGVQDNPGDLASSVQVYVDGRLLGEKSLAMGTVRFDSLEGRVGRVVLVDEQGNALAAKDWSRPAMASTPPVQPEPAKAQPPVEGLESSRGPEKKGSGSLVSDWRLWGGIGATAALAGTVLTILAYSDQSELDRLIASDRTNNFFEAKQVESRMRSRGDWAQISFVAAGASLLGAGYLYWKSSSEDEEDQGLSLNAGAQGFSLSWQSKF